MAFIHNFQRTALVIAICSAISTSAIANSDNDLLLGDISLEDLLNIEVTSASKIATKISKAPAVITAYTQKHMSQYGFNVINDLLYTLPGFGPSQDYDRPTVSARGNFDGWNNNHILHLVDGIPMNDNLYGSAYTWFTPTFTTKTMEVIRGPGSALYGSNATNGVVQMNTFKAADLTKPIYAKVSLYGSDASSRHEFMTGSATADYDFIMAYSLHQTDGNQYTTYDGSGRLSGSNLSDGSAQAATFTKRDNKDDSYFWSKLTIGNHWQIQYHRQEWDFDTGHGWVFWVPDYDEEMNESRDIFSVKYNANISDNWSHEYVMRYQKHEIIWNQRYYPDHAFADYYPSGMWEYLDTEAEDIFVRAQHTYIFSDSNATFLTGIEVDRFSYDGDNEHFSNINVDSDFFEPFPNDANTPLLSWLDYIKDQPVLNTAFYTQLTTGSWLSDDFELTVGVRSDKLSVDYQEVYGTDPDTGLTYVFEQRGEARPKNSKNWSKISPRLAGVWSASNALVLKLMWGKAFRAPTPTEMAGAHTFSLASNIAGLSAELITTTEFQLDWALERNHVFRANVFLTEFENQIAYSTANANLSTNIYSTENFGYEFEFIGNYGDWNWFANLSYVQRQNESILAFFNDANGNPDQTNPEFSRHSGALKWEPAMKVNLGIAYDLGDLDLAMTMHYHGDVDRRDTDSRLIPFDCDYNGTITTGTGDSALPLAVCVPDDFNLDGHRGSQVDSWITFNAKASYEFSPGFKANLEVKNLFGEDVRLIKTGPFPFDYKAQGRHIMVYLQIAI